MSTGMRIIFSTDGQKVTAIRNEEILLRKKYVKRNTLKTFRSNGIMNLEKKIFSDGDREKENAKIETINGMHNI